VFTSYVVLHHVYGTVDGGMWLVQTEVNLRFVEL